MGVIALFTILLFFSGYALQQQSVRNIQSALRPPPDPIPVKGPGATFQKLAQKRGLAGSGLGPLADQEILIGSQDGHTSSSSSSKGNYAYLQLLSSPDPSDICSAILFFKRMSAKKLGKPASIALSILRAASIKYGIWLLPIDMTAATSQGYEATDTKLLRLGQIQFMQYDSVLYVQTPGMILDTERLDEVLLSRPLPLRHDKNRPESFNNEAWIPMPLRAERDNHLPPVYLITVNNVGGGHVEARTHIPNIALPGFGSLVTPPWGFKPGDTGDGTIQQPAYVYFENDRDGQVKWAGNPLFGTWRAQQYEVCEGLDLDDDIYHEQ
jgi:hypothetical protein